jgi:hypothetical protein
MHPIRHSHVSSSKKRHPLLARWWPARELTPREQEILERSKRNHPSQALPRESSDDQEDER